jgi:hypothetical protein
MKLKKVTGSYAGRILLAAVPVAIVSTLVIGGVAQGAVPVSMTISGSQFKISASQLDGTSFSQYAGVATDTAGKQHAVAIANIGQAKLTDLCQSVVADTPLGKVGAIITAGGDGTPAEATDLQIGMTDLKGNTSFDDVRIGVDASTVQTKAKGAAGDFAQDSSSLHITDLQQISWSTTAAVFTLNGMHMRVTTDGEECF